MLEKIEPRDDLHDVMAGIGRHLHNESLALKTIDDRLLAIENNLSALVKGHLTRGPSFALAYARPILSERSTTIQSK
jgi:hypothetical protein